MEITTTHDTIEGKIQTSTVFCHLNAITAVGYQVNSENYKV